MGQYKSLFFIGLLLLVIPIFTGAVQAQDTKTASDIDSCEVIDDWNYEQTEPGDYIRKTSGGSGSAQGFTSKVRKLSASTNKETAKNIALATGGAKDIQDFRNNIKKGYTPAPESIRYEGLFYDYRFSIGDKSKKCSSLFCPTFDLGVGHHPIKGSKETYLGVGLNSGLDTIKRPPLNLVVVLDISGSMGSGFEAYYYDKFGNRKKVSDQSNESKIEVARNVLKELTHQLHPGDRLGIVLFNSRAKTAKPLRPMNCTDTEALRTHIDDDINDRGGTNLEAGLKEARSLFDTMSVGQSKYPRENRLVLLADAMPNTEAVGEGELGGMLTDYAKDRIYTTVIGVGLDVNPDLIKALTQHRGANAYFVNSQKQFKKRLNDEFLYMVTPLAFNVELTLRSPTATIKRTLGTGENPQKGTVLSIPTFFPTATTKGGGKGSAIVSQLNQTTNNDSMTITLQATYTRRDGTKQTVKRNVDLDNVSGFSSPSIRKAIALVRLGDLLKKWAKATYTVKIGDNKSKWERQSVKLTVSDQYKEKFKTMRHYIKEQADSLPGTDFGQEIDLLNRLIQANK